MRQRSGSATPAAAAAAPAPWTLEVTLPDDRQIRMRRAFAAPRAKVFAAWTRPEHVGRWWDPGGKPLAVCEIDLRPGGAFRWVNDVPGHTQVFAGTYVEIVPPERLVLRMPPTPSGEGALSTVLFIDRGDTTELLVTIACGSPAERDMLLAMRVDEGTGRTLDNLERYLEAAPDGGAP